MGTIANSWKDLESNNFQWPKLAETHGLMQIKMLTAAEISGWKAYLSHLILHVELLRAARLVGYVAISYPWPGINALQGLWGHVTVK